MKFAPVFLVLLLNAPAAGDVPPQEITDRVTPDQPWVEIGNLPEKPTGDGEKQQDFLPPQVVARALEPLKETPLAGHSLSLLAAVSAARDTAGQVAVVHVYWDAVGMAAQYNLRRRERAVLERLEPRPGDELMVRMARASSDAAVVEAQIAAVASQHALAERTLAPLASASLPLPNDRPCAAPYETRFEQLFASRPAPAQAWLIHRTLPLKWQAIEKRANAIATAEKALTVSREAYRRGEVDLENVLAALAAWSRQEDALMRNVCDYNHDIADYAAAVAVGPADGATLVSMLIGPSMEPVPEPASGPVGITRIGEPIPLEPSPWTRPRPTLAPAEGTIQPAGHLEPLLDPASSAGSPEGKSPSPRRAPVDGTPNLFPLDEGRLVPLTPNGKAASSNDQRPGEPSDDEAEAPKMRVIPVESAG
ncbi:MAG: hypothetical protein JW719_06035 [Pirellulales bacterium]|nr:hypothetical protein [Pirellulales bacterium]